MSKVLKTVAIVVGAVALVATGIGAAASAGLLGAAAVHGAVIAGLTASSLTSIGAIAGVGAALLSTTAQLTAKKPTATATGSQTSFSADPDAGIPLVLGRTGTAGNIVYRQAFDTADAGTNDRQAFVAALSLGPAAAIEGQTVDRAAVTFGAGGAALGAFAGFMWSLTQLGAIPEPAALGFGAGAGSPPGWTAQHKLSGLAAASWTLRFDTKAQHYQNGVPAPMWTVKGALAYDPRKDSTYPGGSGAHRMADPADTAAYDAAQATWEWTENPFLLGLRWVHGFWQRDPAAAGSTWQRVMGMGAPAAAIDIAAYVEGANLADANGWTCGGVVFSGDDKWDTLKKILQAGMGEPLSLGAKISCLVNTPRVSLATITTADVVGDASVAATQPRRARINTVTPRYRLEANNWELLAGTPIAVPDYVTADGGKRSKQIDYPFIQDVDQVATAVRYDIENAREFGPVSLPCRLLWMGYKPGDCVTATLPELGLNAQPLMLLNRALDPAAAVVTLTARSETAAKHAFALAQTTTPPPTPGVTGPALVPQPGAAAWTIAGASLASADATLPALVVTGAIDFGGAAQIVFEYRPYVAGQDPAANWRAGSVEKPETTRIEIASVQSATPYEVAVSYRARGLTGARLILGPAMTAGIASAQAKAALDAATAAATLAAGKTQYWVQAIAPTGAQTGDNDVWISMTEGNRAYQRIPGTGRLSIGGNRLTIGGSYLIVGPWAPADDQRIAQALLAAAGAQATANGKVSVYKQEATPTATAIGDLWDQPSIGTLKRWDGSVWSSTADITALNQVLVSVPEIAVSATSAGAVTTPLPKSVSTVVTQGGVDVSKLDSTTYALSNASSNVSGYLAVDNANGSASKGQITLSAGFTGSGTATLTVTVAGVVQTGVTVSVVQTNAKPSTGGGSSGSGGAKTATGDLTSQTVSSTTFVAAFTAASLTVASGDTIRCTATGDYEFSTTAGGTGFYSSALAAKWQYSVAGANSWTDFAAASTGSAASYRPSTHDGTTGSIAASQNKAGLSAGTYDVRFVIARTSATTTGSIVFDDGSTSVSVGP